MLQGAMAPLVHRALMIYEDGRAVVHDQQLIDTLTMPTSKIKTRTGNPLSVATRLT